MNNKTVYIDNKTKKRVSIVGEDDSFYIMDNGDNVLKGVFPSHYDPVIENVVDIPLTSINNGHNANVINNSNTSEISNNMNDVVSVEEFRNTKPIIEHFNSEKDYRNKYNGDGISYTQQNEQFVNNTQTQNISEQPVSDVYGEGVIDPSTFNNAGNRSLLSSLQSQAKGINTNNTNIDPNVCDGVKIITPVMEGVDNTTIDNNLANQNMFSEGESLDDKKARLIREYNLDNKNTPNKKLSYVEKMEEEIRNGNNKNNEVLHEEQIRTQDSDFEIDPETGLNKKQLEIREQYFELGKDDPFEDKIRKYKERNLPTKNTVKKNVPEMVGKEHNPMFAMFKKCYDISIDLSVKEKISEPDFIKMATRNLEGDIIDYYTETVIEKLLKNIEEVKKDVYKQIYVSVFGSEPIEEVKKDDGCVNEELKETKSKKEKIESEHLVESGLNDNRYKFYNKQGIVKNYTLKYAKKNKLKPYKENE